MPADASLARLIRDHGGTWVIEHTGGEHGMVAARRDGDDIRILGAHDIAGLRYQIEQAEREDGGEQVNAPAAGPQAPARQAAR